MSVDFNKCLSQLKKGELIKENEIKIICDKAIEILQEEPNLIHLEAPITVCGDIHGQFYDLIELFRIGGKIPHRAFPNWRQYPYNKLFIFR